MVLLLGAVATVASVVAVVKHYGKVAVEKKLSAVKAEVLKDYTTASTDAKALVAKLKVLL